MGCRIFQVSKEMEDIKIAFAQEAFLKGFKLCQRRMVEKIFELDLSFLMGESSDDEARPSTVATDLPPIEPPTATSEPAREFEIVEAMLNPSTVSPPKVGGFQ